MISCITNFEFPTFNLEDKVPFNGGGTDVSQAVEERAEEEEEVSEEDQLEGSRWLEHESNQESNEDQSS